MSQLIVIEKDTEQGIAFSLIRKKDNVLIADAGIIIVGQDGYVWASFTNEIKHHKKEIFVRFKTALHQIITEYKLSRIIAAVKSDLIDRPKFIDRLGFLKTDSFVNVQDVAYCNYIMEVR